MSLVNVPLGVKFWIQKFVCKECKLDLIASPQNNENKAWGMNLEL